jgi:dolichol-phosphate mannosyltransferase
MTQRQAGGLSVIVPCCNEEEAVRLLPDKLFPALNRLSLDRPVELILVDDGSHDQTWPELSRLKGTRQDFTIALVRHETNKGLGAALGSGFLASSHPIVVTLDADGTYPFSIVELLVAKIDAGADIVTASPYHPRGGVEGVSALRLTFSRGASVCYRILVDRHVHTWTAMVRAYRAEVLSKAISPETGFLHVAMTLVEARRRGANIAEVPATLSTRQVGQSKAKVVRITRAHLRYMSGLLWLKLTRRFWIVPRMTRATVAGHG